MATIINNKAINENDLIFWVLSTKIPAGNWPPNAITLYTKNAMELAVKLLDWYTKIDNKKPAIKSLIPCAAP